MLRLLHMVSVAFAFGVLAGLLILVYVPGALVSALIGVSVSLIVLLGIIPNWPSRSARLKPGKKRPLKQMPKSAVRTRVARVK